MKLETPAEKQKRKEKEAKELKERLKFCEANFNAVAATEEGIDVFRYIMERCSYQKNTITINPQTGEINKEASVYLEARRSLYLEIRKYISAKFLKKIEFK